MSGIRLWRTKNQSYSRGSFQNMFAAKSAGVSLSEEYELHIRDLNDRVHIVASHTNARGYVQLVNNQRIKELLNGHS